MEQQVKIMPCLDMQNGRVVKGVHFVDIKDAGDPVECAKAYCEAGADELALLDAEAKRAGRRLPSGRDNPKLARQARWLRHWGWGYSVSGCTATSVTGSRRLIMSPCPGCIFTRRKPAGNLAIPVGRIPGWTRRGRRCYRGKRVR